MRILVIDPQEGWARRGTRTTFERLARFIDRHDAWRHTMITAFSNMDGGPFRQNLAWWRGFQTRDDTAILEAFAARGTPVSWRNTYSLPETVWAQITSDAANGVLLAGVETDASVLQMAMQGFDRGVSMWVAPDLVASTYGRTGQAHGLAVLRKVLGRDHLLRISDLARRLDEPTGQ